MLKMGSLSKAGNGEIRRNCRVVNQIQTIQGKDYCSIVHVYGDETVVHQIGSINAINDLFDCNATRSLLLATSY